MRAGNTSSGDGMAKYLTLDVSGLTEEQCQRLSAYAKHLAQESSARSPFAELSVRAQHILFNDRIRSWEDLALLTRCQVLRVPGLGQRTLAELRAGLEARGLRFADMEL
jgi:DNA-directed RNA polymerase alpha subunit